MTSLPSAKIRKKLTVVAVLSGLLYSSWPLGYALNPAASNGLASDLEAAGQPYNGLFVAIDIACGLLAIGVAYELARWTSARKGMVLLRTAIVGLAMYGLLTIIDALIPIDCVPTAVHHCVSIFSDRLSIVHDLISIGSIFGLTMSLASLWWLLISWTDTSSRLRWMLHGAMLLWFGFGLGTGLLLLLNLPSAGSQHVFIGLCSLLTAAAPYLVYRALYSNGVHGKQEASRH